MFERIKKHVDERDDINLELKKIIGYCNNSPFNLNFLDKKWGIMDNELHLQVKDTDLDCDYYMYELSSLGTLNETFFMGEKDGYMYIMAHHEGDWEATEIFVLKIENKVDNE